MEVAKLLLVIVSEACTSLQVHLQSSLENGATHSPCFKANKPSFQYLLSSVFMFIRKPCTFRAKLLRQYFSREVSQMVSFTVFFTPLAPMPCDYGRMNKGKTLFLTYISQTKRQFQSQHCGIVIRQCNGLSSKKLKPTYCQCEALTCN